MPAAGADGVWLDVPFVKQEKDGCGAASIAMVMQYWLKRQGRSDLESADATEIHRALSAPGASRRLCFRNGAIFRTATDSTHTRFGASGATCKITCEKGRPLIVALKPSGTDVPLHYVVVAGLDSQAGIVLAERSRAAQAAQAGPRRF